MLKNQFPDLVLFLIGTVAFFYASAEAFLISPVNMSYSYEVHNAKITLFGFISFCAFLKLCVSKYEYKEDVRYLFKSAVAMSAFLFIIMNPLATLIHYWND